jgi:hypothetical protein
MRDCPSKHVLVIRDDGEYSSVSDFNEDTLALLADDQEGNDDHAEEHIGIGDADHYESLIVQRVHKWREWSKISDTHCFKQCVSSKNGCVTWSLMVGAATT